MAAILNDADVARIRTVLDRMVESNEDELIRVTFETAESFIFSNIAGFDEEDLPHEERDLVGAWSGLIAAVHDLPEDSRKFFVPGSAAVFYGSEITRIEDEVTGEVLFSRAPVGF